MPKVNIAQLAAFRSGEILTEQKLNEVFTLLGTVVNVQDDLYQQLIKDLQSLKVARRYLGTVDNYQSIEAYINANKDNPIYQPPNDPLPSSGDVLFIKNNSDDPNLPNYQAPGAYMYIYTSDNKWTLYSPFAMVVADATQDGLMSKESFQDLQNVKSDTTQLTNKYNDLKQQVDNLDRDLTTTLKADINKLKETKQDIKTKKGEQFLKGYSTETVEGNLIEVKEQVDFITSASIEIWEAAPNATFTSEMVSNTHYKIYLDINPNSTLVPNSYIKCYFSFPGTNGLDQSFQTTMLVLSDAKNTGYGFASYYDVNLSDWINLQIRYVNDTTVVDTTKQKYFEFMLYDKASTATPITISSLKPVKVIKDLGVSDYLWADLLEKDIKEFLKNYMGIKKYVCYSNANTNNFNGFRTGDTLTLDYYYLYGAKSLTVNVGGINLIQGMEWEEYVDSANPNAFANQIKFLRDVNIEQEGFIEVKGVALVISSMQFKIWNNKDLYQIGELAIESNQVWYAIQPNVNRQPSTNNPAIWKPLTYSIDMDALRREIQEYIRQISTDIVNGVIDGVVDNKLNQLPTVEYKSEGPGVELVFPGGVSAFNNYKQVMGIDDSYFRVKGTRPIINETDIAYKSQANIFTSANNVFDRGLTVKNTFEIMNTNGDVPFKIWSPSPTEIAFREINARKFLTYTREINSRQFRLVAGDTTAGLSLSVSNPEDLVNKEYIDQAVMSRIDTVNYNMSVLEGSVNSNKNNISSILVDMDQVKIKTNIAHTKVNNLESQNLNTRLSTLENYCKTGIIQFVVWNQNGYRIRLIPILTPPNLVGRENELLDRIHVSTTTYKQNNPNNPTIYSEFEYGEYTEILNPRMNEDIEVRSLNTNNFRDNNISMNLYTWWDLNQNLATTLNGDWSPKLIIPITSRYDRNCLTLYFVYRAV